MVTSTGGVLLVVDGTAHYVAGDGLTDVVPVQPGDTPEDVYRYLEPWGLPREDDTPPPPARDWAREYRALCASGDVAGAAAHRATWPRWLCDCGECWDGRQSTGLGEDGRPCEVCHGDGVVGEEEE